MKKIGLLLVMLCCAVHAESPQIGLPYHPPEESTTAIETPKIALPQSMSVHDPQDKRWFLYDNRIVKAHIRVMTSWPIMEVKETDDVGTASFTISRFPLVTFAIMRAPLEDHFDTYLSSSALTPLYPTIQKKYSTVFAGRKGVMIQGIAEDGRRDESFFSAHEKSFYRISLSAPVDAWNDAEKQFDEIRKSFRWLN